ncbi:hypothetical protein GCM10010270_80410 [Streptomyces violaceus]|nr:hypothetical protein GCM10010270_80410 [Streptomyces janthinus]
MRKRPSRPQRFVALDNGSVDTLKSMTAKGLLATLIRAKDGDDVTVEGLCKTHTEGREMLTKAMRALVEDAFVVKFKIQRKASEVITLEDGSTEQRRGGSWWTTFTVDSIPFTADDVTAMLEDIFDDGNGNVKAVRVEPARLDRRERASDPPRPTNGNPSVGATCGNTHSPLDEGEENRDEPDPRPTDGFPTVGGPTVGPSAAHIRKKTSLPHAGDKKMGDVPSARSAVGVRSTSSSGSSELEDGSGFAAAGKEGSSSDQEDGTAGVPGQRQQEEPSLSREQLAAVRAVEAVLPPVLLAKLPYGQFPKRNRPAVLEALESRTVEQLRERVGRRWVAYGYEPALYDGTLTQPVGAALELISPSRYCPDLSCEDGTMIDTGAECRACLERRASRRAARAAGQLEKSSSKRTGSGRAPECVICQAPFHDDVPASGECLRCEKEAAAAFAALSARLGAPDADWQDLEAPADAEPSDGPQDEPEVDEETERLRAFYAHRYGTPDQVEAYCTEAPF